mgnify:CR=1 FL=1
MILAAYFRLCYKGPLDDLTNDVIDRLLFEGLNDNGASVDCIIVLGSMKAAKYRVPAAAKAFFSGRSEKIMLCGGKTRNFSGESMAEADNMYQKALELGVPVKVIENIQLSDQFSLMVECPKFGISAFYVVAKEFCVRRSGMDTLISPQFQQLMLCGSSDLHRGQSLRS